jgi:hypothetical protein
MIRHEAQALPNNHQLLLYQGGAAGPAPAPLLCLGDIVSGRLAHPRWVIPGQPCSAILWG